MSAKSFSVLCLFLAVYCIYAANADSTEYDDSYYNPKTNVAHPKVTGTEAANPSKLIAFHNGECKSANLAVSCCTGVRVKKLKFDKELCAVLGINKQALAVNAAITLNQKNIISTGVSLTSPPPVCVKVPDFPLVQICLKFNDLQISNGKFHACIDFQTRVSKLPTLVLHFTCVTI